MGSPRASELWPQRSGVREDTSSKACKHPDSFYPFSVCPFLLAYVPPPAQGLSSDRRLLVNTPCQCFLFFFPSDDFSCFGFFLFFWIFYNFSFFLSKPSLISGIAFPYNRYAPVKGGAFQCKKKKKRVGTSLIAFIFRESVITRTFLTRLTKKT